jgi:hypothetical protein
MPREFVPLDDSLGRTLREDLIADEPNPRFANSAMDGFAVRASDIASAPVGLRVVETVPAGKVPVRSVGAGEAIRIMTGAPIPSGADVVVPVERTSAASGDSIRIEVSLPAGEHVLSIRDLAYGGGPSYTYRVTLQTTLAAPDAPPQDFNLRFQPDAARIHRGGNAKLWLDVTRLNFPAEVALAVDGLPPGVSVSSSAAFPPVTSGILMLSAAPDAPIGSYPITIKATASLQGELATRVGKPETSGRHRQRRRVAVCESTAAERGPIAGSPQGIHALRGRSRRRRSSGPRLSETHESRDARRDGRRALERSRSAARRSDHRGL